MQYKLFTSYESHVLESTVNDVFTVIRLDNFLVSLMYMIMMQYS